MAINDRERIKNLVKQELQRILDKEPPEDLTSIIAEDFIKWKFNPEKKFKGKYNTDDVKHFIETIDIDDLKAKY